MNLWSGEQRRLGWHDALSAARLPRSKKQLAIGNWTPTSGEDGLRQLLKDNPDLANEIEKRIKEKLGIGPRVDAPAVDVRDGDKPAARDGAKPDVREGGKGKAVKVDF